MELEYQILHPKKKYELEGLYILILKVRGDWSKILPYILGTLVCKLRKL